MTADFELLRLLRRRSVPFAVVGGHAVNVHGYLRATEDVDVVWSRSPASEAALAAALIEADAHYLGREIDPATGVERAFPVTPAFVAASHLMMLTTRLGFIDLFDYVPGLPDADVGELLATSVEVSGIRFASLAWLRRMKLAAGRPKDLLDLTNLPPA